MAKKGIASIGGNPNPIIGKSEVYHAKTMYPGTILTQTDYNKIKWILFKKINGEWVEAVGNAKTGYSASYTFTELSINKELLLEAYFISPEMKVIPGMLIKPIAAEKPSFTKLELHDAEGKDIKEALSYGQTIVAKATCVGMEGQSVTFQLWEDDMPGEGHNTGNEKNGCETQTQIVKKGIATANFFLKPDFAKIADAYLAPGDTSEGANHEYYVTVQDSKTFLASKNANVKNPNYTAPAPVKSKPEPAKPAPKPDPVVPKQPDPIKVAVKPAVKPDPKPEPKNSPVGVGATPGGNCGEKYCIKKGDKNELIREINIRLAGFGGNVPTDEFTERTEKMIKQFQKDYMKVPETGKVCGNTLRAIDKYQLAFPMNFKQIKCKCGTCEGFGKGRAANSYQVGDDEGHRKFEYPGLHRSILSAYRASLFYTNRDKGITGLQTYMISSGYRCHDHPQYKKTHTTNHCGKALDILYSRTNGSRSENPDDVVKIRKEIFIKYLNAGVDWVGPKDIFNLESTKMGAGSWVHVDVREFSQKYLTKNYFVKNNVDFDGKSIIQLATELGFGKTCSCLEGKAATKEVQKTEPVKKSGLFDVPILKTLSSSKDLKEISEILNEYAPKYEINTPLRAAHFLAQVTHECDGFLIKEESYKYNKARIKEIFGRYFPGEVPDKYVRSKLLFDRTYADRMGNGNEASGDGSKFRGRGAVQLTGRESYRNYSNWYKKNFNEDVDFEANPDLLYTSYKYSLLSAIWEYCVDKKNLNGYADKDDIKTITKRINGGLNGFSERKSKLAIAKKAYGI